MKRLLRLRQSPNEVKFRGNVPTGSLKVVVLSPAPRSLTKVGISPTRYQKYFTDQVSSYSFQLLICKFVCAITLESLPLKILQCSFGKFGIQIYRPIRMKQVMVA